MTPLIAVRELTKIHAAGTPIEVRALDRISFEIQRGGYVAIVGESGSGKTTLMHVLGALDSATSGQVLFDGEDLATATRAQLQIIRSRAIGFVFQGFNLIPSLTAHDNVMLAARYARATPRAARERARELLAEVGLADRVDHEPMQLSGGQQQRVAIARALVNAPQLLLADEPTGELDTKTAETILALLESLRAQRGVTLVMVTHNPMVWQRADRVIHLADGRIERIDAR